MKPPLNISIVLLLLVSLLEGVAETPSFRAELDSANLEPSTEYLNVSIQGKKIGWMVERFSRKTYRGEEVFALEVESTQKFLNDGKPLVMVMRDAEYFSTVPPFKLRYAVSTASQNNFESATKLEPSKEKDGEFVARIFEGGKERQLEVGVLDYAMGDVLAGAVWCEQPRKVGDVMRARELNLIELELRTGTNEIKRVLPTEGDGARRRMGLTGKYEIEYYEPIEKVRGLFVLDATGRLLEGKISGAVTLEVTTEADAKRLEADLDLFESSLIKIDQRLGDPAKIRELVLELEGGGIEAIGNSAYQKAEYDVGKKRLRLSLGKGHGEREKVTPTARAAALKETSLYPINDAEVIALGKKAVGAATRPKARIKRLVDFVDEFVIDDYGKEPLSVADIIATKRGDCTEHSQLFVTLARSLGIPAREVSGFIYGEAADNSFGGHAWCEVEVDGVWHPVDPTWGETMINATHIRISGDRPSSEELDIYLGGIKMRVVSMTDKRGKKREFR